MKVSLHHSFTAKTLFLVVCCSFCALSAITQRPNDWKDMNLKGKPYRIVSAQWDLVLKFGEWTKAPELEHKQTIEFNEAGFMTMASFQRDTFTFQYDINHLLTAEFSNGVLQNTYEYQLDDNNRITRQMKKNVSGVLLGVIKYKYDTQGWITQEAAYNKEGDPTKITDYVRNVRGQVIREKIQQWGYGVYGGSKADGGIRAQQWEYTLVYRYNEHNDCIYEAKYYDYAPGKQPISETQKAYRYDSKGNAISVVVENQKEKYVIEHEIQYDRPDNSLSELPLNALEQVSVNNNPVTSAETMPTFRSGDIKAFAQWCAQNVRYPQTAIDNGYQGKVMIQFIVERDGFVSNVTVLQGANQVLNQEAIRVVQSSLKWSPGMNGRVPVRVQMEVPIRFILEIIN